VVFGEVFFDIEHDRHQNSATRSRFVKKFHIFSLGSLLELAQQLEGNPTQIN